MAWRAVVDIKDIHGSNGVVVLNHNLIYLERGLKRRPWFCWKKGLPPCDWKGILCKIQHGFRWWRTVGRSKVKNRLSLKMDCVLAKLPFPLTSQRVSLSALFYSSSFLTFRIQVSRYVSSVFSHKIRCIQQWRPPSMVKRREKKRDLNHLLLVKVTVYVTKHYTTECWFNHFFSQDLKFICGLTFFCFKKLGHLFPAFLPNNCIWPKVWIVIMQTGKGRVSHEEVA